MLIQMKGLERVYRKDSVKIVALHTIDLSIAEGEFAAIMGPSGSGKSTLLHLTGCLDQPSHGEYLLDSIDVSQLGDPQLSLIRNQKIGFVFQSFNLLPQHTVVQNIEAPLLYHANQGGLSTEARELTPGERQTRAQAIAEQVGLGNRLYHRPSELSGGEMQRVAIARALVTQPRVILADEPTGNLDSKTGHEIMTLLQGLHEQGHTIIIVTHEKSIAAYAERVIFLKDGHIEREETHIAQTTTHTQRPVASDSTETHDPNILNNHPSPAPQTPGVSNIYRLLPASCHMLPSILQTAIQGVLLHKLRSFLSVLGIVFGIGAIIAMLAIGAGARQEIIEQIALLGTNTISVKAISPSEEMVSRGREELSQGVTSADVDHIIHVSPFIQYLAPIREFLFPVQYQQRIIQARIIGTSPDFQHTGNLHIHQGRFLTPVDEREMQRVCVLGADIRQALFAFQNPIGDMVKIRNDWFRVIGTLENKTMNQKQISSIQMRNVNTQVYIPLSTSSVFVQPREHEHIQEISIQVDEPEHVDDVARLIRNVLARVHHGAKDYEVIVPSELLKQSQQTQNVFNIVMGSIAGISLLVGGIGIMNIMLATVTERTREIGIRRAIGASQRMILLQFLIETLVLTLVGGGLGILLGVGGASLISVFAGWRTVISFQTILLAFSISATIGIAFGLYPASQGAKMNPILALRYE